MMSCHSTAVTTSSASTRKSPVSSTTSHTSSMLPPHPYCRTPPLPTKGNEKQSSSFSRKSMPTSGHLNDSLTPQTTMPQNSKRSLRTRPSTQTSTEENSPGDQCRNGSNCRHRNKTDALATLSAFHSNRCPSYNPCADESDYDNNETPDIMDLYSDEVYNNID